LVLVNRVLPVLFKAAAQVETAGLGSAGVDGQSRKKEEDLEDEAEDHPNSSKLTESREGW